MIVLVSLIVLLKGFPCLHDFSQGASLHPYSFIFTFECICICQYSLFVDSLSQMSGQIFEPSFLK